MSACSRTFIRSRNFITDSGGPGEFRGGCGSHFVKEVRAPTYVNQYVVNQRHIHPGIAGGRPWQPGCLFVEPGNRTTRRRLARR